MRKFSPEDYVRHVKSANFESAMVYACCHNGNCYYPTKVGYQHRNLQGRDIFGETVSLMRKEGIVPIAYYTVNYHNDCARRFPQAQLVDNCGNRRDGRYHFTCPNQPDAVRFYQSQIREIMEYDIEGIFIDMTFWPSICCCDACREKFGRPLPEKIDWSDPEWVKFQRFREKSMAEFAAVLSETVRKVKPGASVTHQFSPVLHGWYLGQSAGIAAASDYASGDFYGNKLQQRFAVKAFDAFTQKAPFEFMTSRCVTLRDHTSNKNPQELLLSAMTTLANGGAYFFIDAINPEGTLRASVYKTLGDINRQLTPFRRAVADKKFRLTASTALYFSIGCCVDRNLNGKKFMGFNGGCANNMDIRKNAVLDEVLGCADVLTKMHRPYKVITGFDDLADYRSVIVNNASFISAADCEKLREFVRKGGTLIVTGATSLQDEQGNSNGNFQLSDVFGVDYCGISDKKISYLGKNEILADTNAVLVSAHDGTEVEEYLNFPDFPIQDPDNYAAIHSDPPGLKTSDYPGLTRHAYGAGECIYLASGIFILRQYTQQEFCKELLSDKTEKLIAGQENLPPSVEVTLLKAENSREHLLCLVNLQDEFPVIPLHSVRFSFYPPSEVSEIIRISDGKKIEFTKNNGMISLEIPVLETGEFYLLK